MKMLIKILSFVACLSLLVSCQKEDQSTLLTTINEESESLHLKSGSISDLLVDLKGKIETMVSDDLLSAGNGNALISKINAAIKSFDRGSILAFTGQLNALIHNVESFVEMGILTSEQGQSLISIIGKIIILSEGGCIDLRDGHQYSVVIIGDQVWMGENLAYLPSVSFPASGSLSEPFYYVYDYNGTDVVSAKATVNYSTYGTLYNWPAAMTACPTGWHLPTDAEWDQLAQFISDKLGPYTNEGTLWQKVGGHLKSTYGWPVGCNGTDDFGFSALPGGGRMPWGAFGYFGNIGYWWGFTVGDSPNAWIRFIRWDGSELHRRGNDVYKDNGYSIRCVKD
jgi:uncharacterized protein (TIGR02145 family)